MILEVEMFKVFVLVLVRFSGLIIAAPVLGSNNFPVLGKIGLAALSALLVTPMVTTLVSPIPDEPLAFAILATGELLIGMLLGFIMTLVFAAIQIAGQVMDMQSGFGLINVFNPALETQFPIFGFFFFILAVLYLLVIDGHHMMIRALVASFDNIPVGGIDPDQGLLWAITEWGGAMFYDAMLIAAPVAGAMLVAYVTMGLMGRLIPQIHMFVVGFPLTIATSLLIVGLGTGIFIEFMDGMFTDMFRNVETAIRGLG